MASDREPAQRKGGGLQRFLGWLVILGLLGAVGWLASERNERRFFLRTSMGQLVVERGRFFPVGSVPIRGEDAEWGKAYGPVALPPGAKAPSQLEFDSQNALDRALAEQLEGWARETAKKGDAPSMQLANEYVRRASLLPGLTAQQLDMLQGLRADLSWDQALVELQQAAQLVDSARRKLDAVRQAKGSRSLDAGALEPELSDVSQRLNKAGRGKER